MSSLLGCSGAISAVPIFLLAGCGIAFTEADADVARTDAAAGYNYVYLPTGGSPDRVLRQLPYAGWYYQPNVLAGTPAEFDVFFQTTEGYLLRGLSESGLGEVIVVDNGVQLKRLDTSKIPTTGSATYTGVYGAIVSDGARDFSPETVSGNATLQVSFPTQNVSGSITDRVYDGLVASDDVVLNLTNLSDGAFTGTTTGGGLNAAGITAGEGAYTGMLVGAHGEEAIGGITIVHSGADVFTEHGGFILKQ